MLTKANLAWVLAILFLTVGCARQVPSTAVSPIPAGDPGIAGYVLPAEPTGAVAVIEARKLAKDGDDIVIVGRIGGSAEPIVKNRLAFTIVDPSLKPCNERGDDACTTPWDYCCDAPEEIARASAFIRFVDEQDKTRAGDAQVVLGVKTLKTVVVRGKAKREEGNLTVLASGLYVKP